MDNKGQDNISQEVITSENEPLEKISEGTFVKQLNEAEELEIINAKPKEFQEHALQHAQKASNEHESLMYNALCKEIESRQLFNDKYLIDKNERKEILDNKLEKAFDVMLQSRLKYEFDNMTKSFERYLDNRLKKRFYELLTNHDKMLEQQGYLLTPEALEEQGLNNIIDNTNDDEEPLSNNERQRKENSNIIVKSSEAMMSMIEIYRKMPKDVKPSFGKIWVEVYMQYFLSITKAYKMYNKESSLKNADMYLFQYNQLTEALTRNKLISIKECNIITQQSNELGKMLGGWIKAEKRRANQKNGKKKE